MHCAYLYYLVHKILKILIFQFLVLIRDKSLLLRLLIDQNDEISGTNVARDHIDRH